MKHDAQDRLEKQKMGVGIVKFRTEFCLYQEMKRFIVCSKCFVCNGEGRRVW